jgi:hypothetical protein
MQAAVYPPPAYFGRCGDMYARLQVEWGRQL